MTRTWRHCKKNEFTSYGVAGYPNWFVKTQLEGLFNYLTDPDMIRAEQFYALQQQYQKLETDANIPACIFRPLTIADQPERDAFKKQWLRPGAQCDLKLSACGNEIRSAQFAVVPTGGSKDILRCGCQSIATT